MVTFGPTANAIKIHSAVLKLLHRDKTNTHGKANKSIFARVQMHQSNSTQALITGTKRNLFQVYLHIPSDSLKTCIQTMVLTSLTMQLRV
jgi:hypothetical protein